jgi:hypothetical protein
MTAQKPRSEKVPKKFVPAREKAQLLRTVFGNKNDTAAVSLRIPVAMLRQVDDAVRKRPYKMPRHLWLLEAIHEKLMRLLPGEPGSE